MVRARAACAMGLAVMLVGGCKGKDDDGKRGDGKDGRAPRVTEQLAESKVDIAKLMVQKLALEAYPSWSVRNPTSQCPSSVDELAATIGERALVDPWGNSYKMMCEVETRSGAYRVGIFSLGPNGHDDSGDGDDITSWK